MVPRLKAKKKRLDLVFFYNSRAIAGGNTAARQRLIDTPLRIMGRAIAEGNTRFAPVYCIRPAIIS